MGLNNGIFAQLNVTTGLTPTQYVQNVLVGGGVTVSNVTFQGTVHSIGEFTNGNTTNLGLNEGLILSSGVVDGFSGQPLIGSPASSFVSSTLGSGSDPQLAALIPGYTIYDATVVQFDFNPLGDTIKFNYVFGSEEYPEWVGSSFNDVFGFFVTGPNPSGGNYTNYNIAIIPGTALPVTIDNVNSGSWSTYYVDNQGLGGATIVYDGFTTVLTAWCLVTPCVPYHIKIAVGDAGDQAYDSGVFLEKNSFSTNGIEVGSEVTSPNIDSIAVEGCNNTIISFILPQNTPDSLIIHYTISGTATNGTDYLWIPDSLVFAPGTDSTGIEIVPIADGITEGMEDITFTFQISICGGFLSYTVFIGDNTPIIANCVADTSICLGSQANLSVSSTGGLFDYLYQWNPGAGTDSSAIVSPTTSTTYVVTVSDLCSNVAVDSVHVNVFNIATLTGSTNPLCSYSSDGSVSVTPTGGISPYTYSWSSGQSSSSVNGLPSGSYIYTITDSIGCQAIDTITITAPDSLIATITDTTHVLCFNGTTGSATATVIGGSPTYTYLWSPSGGNGSIGTNLGAGTYIVSVTDNHGCISLDTVIIMQPAELIAVLSPVNANCSYSCNGSIDDTINGGVTPYTYNWSTSPPQNTQSATNLCDGDYTVTITDANGCLKTLTATVGINTIISSTFTADAVWGVIPFTVNLTYGGSGANSYLWNFGDGTTSSDQNPSHTYTTPGDYTITLVVNSDSPDYCVDSTSLTVKVEIPSFIDVPNVFTPNGDGFNDNFTIKQQGLDVLEVTIFNRWGKQVYKWTTVDGKWDGKGKNGSLEADGVYFWVLYAKGLDKVEYNQKGTITLIR